MRTWLRIVLAVALVFPAEAIAAQSAGAASGTTCTTFSGTARVTPGLPMVGSKQLVRPTASIKAAKLGSCHGEVSSGTVSATIRFAKPSNCTLLIRDITANVAWTTRGTATVVWNNHKTSNVAFSLSFGGVNGDPALAAVAGTVRSGMFKGLKVSGTVLWTLGSTECFGGAPLKSLTFSAFAPFVAQ